MMNDGKRLDDINLTDEQLEKIKSILEQERVKGKVVEKQNVKSKYDYDFSKVNLRNFSKKQLIRIIYDLKRQFDMYKAGVSDDMHNNTII